MSVNNPADITSENCLIGISFSWYFDTNILNKLLFGPGLTITPIKQEPHDNNCTASDLPTPNINHYNGFNGAIDPFLNAANSALPANNDILPANADLPAFQDVSKLITENILHCLQKKVPKKPKPVEKNPIPPPVELDEPIHCEICDVTYKNNVAFALHSDKHNEDGKFACHLCDYKNSSKYHIEMHIRAHEGTTKYKCEICDKAFTVSTHAIEHKYFHSGEKPFECDICGKHFMFSWFLTSHRRTQHWELVTGSPLVKYDCTICNKHYTSSTGLKRHNLSKHNSTGVDPSVLCDICGKRLSSKEKLKFHRRTHTGYKPYSCEVCTKSFSRKEQLKEHERVHTGEKPYKCQYCGKGFTQRSPLRIHERTHTGERPYVCKICNKGFISKGVMDTHMKTCSGRDLNYYVESENEVGEENIYIIVSDDQDSPKKKRKRTKRPPPYCNFCKKKFKNNINYAKHSLKHSIDNIFRCFMCNITARMTVDQIETHIRIHENKPKYDCEFCDAKLYSDYAGIQHEKWHLGKKSVSSHSCDFCSQNFMFLCSLEAHTQKCRPASETNVKSEKHLPIPIEPIEPITCNICRNTFDDNIDYSLHIVEHEEDGQFKCYMCGLKSKMASLEIREHIKTHLNGPVHQCPVCKRGFARRIDAIEHVNFHEGLKPLQCKICNVHFMFTRCLLSHRKNYHNLTGRWFRGCSACDINLL